MANVPAGTDQSSVLIRTLSHTLYAFLATLTTGRSFQFDAASAEQKRVRSLETVGGGNAPKTAGKARRRFAMLQAVLQPGMDDNPAKFEEACKTWEHQVDVYEKLATSKSDDDLKISVVLLVYSTVRE